MLPSYCTLAFCPHCGAEKEIIQFMSGNTFGAVLWSDAKREAPMLPTPSPVQKCQRCGHFFFLDKAVKAEGNTYSFEQGWLTFDDSIRAFEELSNQGKDTLELLTIIIAWAYNDMLRKNQEPTQEQTAVFKNRILENLSQGILTENELLKAELYREIGRYEECISILENFPPEGTFLENLIKEIIERAKKQDDKVFVLSN